MKRSYFYKSSNWDCSLGYQVVIIWLKSISLLNSSMQIDPSLILVIKILFYIANNVLFDTAFILRSSYTAIRYFHTNSILFSHDSSVSLLTSLASIHMTRTFSRSRGYLDYADDLLSPVLNFIFAYSKSNYHTYIGTKIP